ncbi:M23 family metallopeptidase [Rhodococcus sp. D2-41]|uniref:M23 family metallopeptidase n=1 Tax=Speluncibacter jeojiensis TaxID=2710754 RepID=UPI002410AD6B|nr:M23 family metallopeptidase [Rhodococcus sp. D2-41]MDG3010096.1 M23 family metallopeptidase [Rhodococcus sp. D2-41]
MTRRSPDPAPPATRRPAARAALALPGLAVLLTGLLSGCSSASGSRPATAPAPNWADETVRPDAQAQATPIAVRVVSTPRTVVAADGFVHLPYAIALQNLSAYPVTVQSIQALNADTQGTAIANLSGPALEEAVAQSPESTADSTATPEPAAGPNDASASPAVLAPGSSATVDIDAFVPMRTTIARIEHRVSIDWTEQTRPLSLTFTAARTTVDAADAVVVSPPLRGPGWVAAAGCCQTADRPDAPRAVDGTLVPADRFALDLRKLDAAGGFGTAATSSAPEPVLAVGDATVVAATPGSVILDLGPGGGRYATYTHLHDTAVRAGERVHTGQVIGHLAATASPRLGFAVVDRPSLRQSRGLPYEFTAFSGLGRVTDLPAMTAPTGDAPLPVDPSVLTGPHNRQLPLVGQVLGFS